MSRYPLQITTLASSGMIRAWWGGNPRGAQWFKPAEGTDELTAHRNAAWALIADEAGTLMTSIRNREGRYTHSVYPDVVR